MSQPKIKAVAQFQKNMVETLNQYFHEYAIDGIVTVEVTDHGLWVVNPLGPRQFLGATERMPTNATQKLI